MSVRRRHCGDERGLAVVEFAFVGLILLVIVAGAIDFGLAWRSGLALTDASRNGARVGSSMAKNPSADYSVLSSVRASLESAGKLDATQVVVLYRSTTANGRPPSECITAPYTTGSADCIVMTGAQLNGIGPGNFSFVDDGDATTPPTGTGCASSNYTRRTASWCPSQRLNALTNAHYIGVFVRMRHDNLFKVLGASRMVERYAVMKLEPDPI